MTAYRPARHYLPAAVAALGLAAFSFWVAWQWIPAYLAAGLLVLSSALLFFLATRPPIQIRETRCSVGKRSFLWSEVERLEVAGWRSPLLLRVALRGNRTFLLIYPGEPEMIRRLLRHIERLARAARPQGLLYSPWGEASAAEGDPEPMESPQYQMISPDDEAEVERLYQKLKSAGRLDHQTSEERRD